LRGLFYYNKLLTMVKFYDKINLGVKYERECVKMKRYLFWSMYGICITCAIVITILAQKGLDYPAHLVTFTNLLALCLGIYACLNIKKNKGIG